jgi:hypothetical protein
MYVFFPWLNGWHDRPNGIIITLKMTKLALCVYVNLCGSFPFLVITL